MNLTSLLPALVLSLGLVASGCSDDAGGGGEAAAEPISKADFTSQADEICADGTAQLSTEAESLGEAPSQEQIEQFAVDVLVPNIQGQHDDIEDLGAPDGDEDEVRAILDALQEGIDAVEADPSLITSTDDPFQEASDLAGDYGLTECAV